MQDKFFLAVKTISELFALLVLLLAIFVRCVELLILAMLLRKRGWRGKLLMKSVFNGLKNVLLKENAMVSSHLVLAMTKAADVRESWKK
jgi:hypothetical protein